MPGVTTRLTRGPIGEVCSNYDNQIGTRSGCRVSIPSSVPVVSRCRGLDRRPITRKIRILVECPRGFGRPRSASTEGKSTSSQNRVTSSNIYLLHQLRNKKLCHTRSHVATVSRYHGPHPLITNVGRGQSQDTITHLRTNKRFTIRFHWEVYCYFHPITYIRYVRLSKNPNYQFPFLSTSHYR